MELFQIETYKDARISSPSKDMIVADGVMGHPLKITFKKVISHWDVSIEVMGYLTDQEEPNFVHLHRSSGAADEAKKKFWEELIQLAFHRRTEDQDARVLRAQQMLEGKSKSPKKK